LGLFREKKTAKAAVESGRQATKEETDGKVPKTLPRENYITPKSAK
jgi:hypothetical protein